MAKQNEARNLMIGDIQQRAFAIREAGLRNTALAVYIETDMPPANLIPQPFVGGDDIRLIVVGQDPTVSNRNSQKKITTALMLDQHGPLRNYIKGLCIDLGLQLAQVDGTNVFKMVLTDTPTRLKKRGVDVLALIHQAGGWLDLLADEVAQFPDALIITLGEPVLSFLVEDAPKKMRHYWGYLPRWKEEPLREPGVIPTSASTIGRTIAPFPHVNSKNWGFYYEARPAYVSFVRETYFRT
jgi:hypothetical protein